MKEIKTYTVHVICRDDVEYDREASKKEIDKQRKGGWVRGSGYNGLIFDFTSLSHEAKDRINRIRDI